MTSNFSPVPTLHNLSPLTQAYLQSLTKLSSSGTVPWPRVKQLMNDINYPNSTIDTNSNSNNNNNGSYDVQHSIVLLNAMKHILISTFGNVNGIRDNRMYTWMAMVWAYHLDTVITTIQNKMEAIMMQTDEQNKQTIQSKSKQVILDICNGLLLCQILVSLVQNSSKGNMSNRVMYPEMYRFIQIALQCLAHLHVQIPVSTELQLPIKTTQIISKIVEGRRPQQSQKQIDKKTKKNKVSKSKQVSIEHICCDVAAKVIQLMGRSFELCKKNIVMKLTAVKTNINGMLKHIAKYEQKNGEIIINVENTESNPTLATIISNYLKQFQQGQGQQEKVNEEIDEENKIIEVKELTPRLVEDQPNFEIKKLRTKKKKLIKRIESDARTAKRNKLQEQRVIQEVRTERVNKKHKKQIFVMQKQTEEAKKQHKKTKRIKQIQKQGGKGRGKGNKFDAIAKSKKIKK